MNIDEMIKVMESYKNGEEIEYRNKLTNDTIWYEIGEYEPTWNWGKYDYRVKTEPKYIPYDSVLEVEKDKWVRDKDCEGILSKITAINARARSVRLGSVEWITLQRLFEKYIYKDGTPCGKKVE